MERNFSLMSVYNFMQLLAEKEQQQCPVNSIIIIIVCFVTVQFNITVKGQFELPYMYCILLKAQHMLQG